GFEEKDEVLDAAYTYLGDQNAATIAMGKAQAETTKIDSWSTISGSTTGMVTAGFSATFGMYAQSKADLAGTQLENLSGFKESLATQKANGVTVPGDDPLAVQNQVGPKTEFQTAFEEPGNLEAKAKQFNNQEDANYFKTKATGFAGSDIDAALSQSDALETYLNRQVKSNSDKAHSMSNLGQSLSQAANGLVSGSIKIQSADAQLQQSQKQ